MAKVIFLDKLVTSEDVVSPVEGLNALKRELNTNTKAEINRQLPFYGTTHSTIDDVIERQRINGYLSGKGIVMLYPGSGSAYYNDGTHLVFPYNMAPNLSVPTLVALKRVYQRAQLPLRIEERLESNFDIGSKEEELATMTLRYLAETQANGSDRRLLKEKSVYDAARNFMRAYQALKDEMALKPKDTMKSLALVLAFTSAYHKTSIFQNSDTFRNDFPYSGEFFKQTPVEVDLNQFLDGRYDGRPIKKYIKNDNLDRAYKRSRLSRTKIWKFISTRLAEEPVKG